MSQPLLFSDDARFLPLHSPLLTNRVTSPSSSVPAIAKKTVIFLFHPSFLRVSLLYRLQIQQPGVATLRSAHWFLPPGCAPWGFRYSCLKPIFYVFP